MSKLQEIIDKKKLLYNNCATCGLLGRQKSEENEAGIGLYANVKVWRIGKI